MYGYPKKLVVFKLQCPQYPSAFSIINVWQPKKMHKKGQCGIDAILQFILSCPDRKELLIVEESFALRSECVLCLSWLFRHFVFFSLSTISFGPITASIYLFIYFVISHGEAMSILFLLSPVLLNSILKKEECMQPCEFCFSKSCLGQGEGKAAECICMKTALFKVTVEHSSF